MTAAGILSSFPFLSVSAHAVAPTYGVSPAYADSIFYDSLLDVELSGDMRRDVVSVAYSQLGYHEGDTPAELHGRNISGDRNFVEYNRISGVLDNGEGNGVSPGYAWCASFLSWCLRQARVPQELAPDGINSQRMLDDYRAAGRYHARASGYTPIPGDIVMFRYGGSRANHVGLVVGVEDGRVYTIEGNTSGMVGLRTYRADNAAILGYCVPDYEVEPGGVYEFPLHATYEAGAYITLAKRLNVRVGPSTATSRLGRLPAGTQVTVYEVQGEWGRIEYDGREAWICLQYALPAPKSVR